MFEFGRWRTLLGDNFIAMLESGSAQIPLGIIVPISNLLGLDPKKLLREVMICRHPDLAKYL